ncbi:MAG: hypothetical protein JWQ96_1782 [Segetibacter sp.]|nr:hypothetical protein [Segetibacter sp.]
MRKILLVLTLTCATWSFGQTTEGQKKLPAKNIYEVAMVQPRSGQAPAFETAWKIHLVKYHNGESKRAVFEVITGDNAGTYQLIDGPFDYAEIDKELPNVKAHDNDYGMSVSNKLAMEKGGYMFRWLDTLSYNYKDISADKYLQNNYMVKQGKLADFLKELRRSVVINELIKSPSSITVYLQLLAGSKQQIVFRSALKDGFKELDPTYSPSTTEAFKAAYIKEYGQADWDKRANSPGIYQFVDSFESFLIKRRIDLSSSMPAVKATTKK